MELIWYSKCSTCRNAKKFLDDKNIKYSLRNIKENNPTKEEISSFLEKYNLEVNKLFNTSGRIYRELNLKDKLQNLTKEEKIDFLSGNGMLIKRPLLIANNKLLIGFNIKEWENHFN